MPDYKLKLLVLKKLFTAFLLGMITMAGFCAGLVLGYHGQTMAGFFTVALSLSIGTAATMGFYPFLESLFAPQAVPVKHPNSSK
jgi:hypothetical protein